MSKEKNRRKKGFTLIELLVVISIIGFLSTLAVVSLNNARIKSRDAKRKADLKQIQTALEVYYDKNNYYPTEMGCDSSIGSCNTACNTCGASDWNYTVSGLIAQTLKTNGIVNTLPIDPKNGNSYYYWYEPDCNQGKCPSPEGCCYYQIGVTLEGGGSFTLSGGKQ